MKDIATKTTLPNESREVTHAYAHVCAATLDHLSYFPGYDEWMPLCEEIAYLAKIHEIISAGGGLWVPIVENPNLKNLWQLQNTVRISKPRHVATIWKEKDD